MNQELVHTEAVAALARLEKRHPELKQELEMARATRSIATAGHGEVFEQGKSIGFAANASAVIVKGGAAATNNYKQGLQIYVHTEGGLAAEAAIGGQKLIYKPAALTRRKTTDGDTAEKRGHTQPAVDSHPPS